MQYFTCSRCGGTYPQAWTDAEAWEEYKQTFGDSDKETETVCDDCYQWLMAKYQQRKS